MPPVTGTVNLPAGAVKNVNIQQPAKFCRLFDCHADFLDFSRIARDSQKRHRTGGQVQYPFFTKRKPQIPNSLPQFIHSIIQQV